LRNGIANGARDKGGNNLGEGNNGEADKSVEDGTFSFLELAWIALRSHIADAADNNKNCGDDASDANNPLNGVGDHSVRINATASRGTITYVATTTNEGNTNSVHDDVSRHDDGKANKSLSEGFFAGGDFAWVTARKYIEIATINDVADDEVSGNYGNVGNNVSHNSPNV